MLSEKAVKILKRDAKEEVTSHEISQICCVVRDSENPQIFGYATTTAESQAQAQNTAHVFTTDSNVKQFVLTLVIFF